MKCLSFVLNCYIVENEKLGGCFELHTHHFRYSTIIAELVPTHFHFILNYSHMYFQSCSWWLVLLQQHAQLITLMQESWLSLLTSMHVFTSLKQLNVINWWRNKSQLNFDWPVSILLHRSVYLQRSAGMSWDQFTPLSVPPLFLSLGWNGWKPMLVLVKKRFTVSTYALLELHLQWPVMLSILFCSIFFEHFTQIHLLFA